MKYIILGVHDLAIIILHHYESVGLQEVSTAITNPVNGAVVVAEIDTSSAWLVWRCTSFGQGASGGQRGQSPIRHNGLVGDL